MTPIHAALRNGTEKLMNESQSLVDELEAAIASDDLGRRALILRRVADLFGSTSGKLSAEQAALFDDVMNRLVDEVDASVRAWLAESLANSPLATPQTLRRLALDDVIDIARPILANSEHLDEVALTQAAKCRSQLHLLAISTRRTIPESVTDVLLERGDRQVALSTAGNPGAALSEFGYSELVRRSSEDDDLAVCTLSRQEIPRRHLLKLFANASESVKQTLSKQDPRKAALIAETVSRAASRLQTRTREASPEFEAARSTVQQLGDAGKLTEAILLDLAVSGKFAETVLAFSIMAELPVDLIERALVEERSEQILVLAKAAGLGWATTKAILQVRAGLPQPAGEIDKLFETFFRLKPDTARKAVEFYRLRERSLAAPAS